MKPTTMQVSADGVMQANGGRSEELDPGMERGGWARPLFDNEAGPGGTAIDLLTL
jgi:hypothetical protein